MIKKKNNKNPVMMHVMQGWIDELGGWRERLSNRPGPPTIL